jgi:hypothetical protein
MRTANTLPNCLQRNRATNPCSRFWAIDLRHPVIQDIFHEARHNSRCLVSFFCRYLSVTAADRAAKVVVCLSVSRTSLLRPWFPRCSSIPNRSLGFMSYHLRILHPVLTGFRLLIIYLT